MKRRKYIPLAVRIKVVSRQLHLFGGWNFETALTERQGLSVMLHQLAGRLGVDPASLQLHHRPALVNRPLNKRKTDTVPPANDPAYLIYLPRVDHDIETRVRGVGAQRSDLGQCRYLKKVAKNRAKRKKPSGFRSFGKLRPAKSYSIAGEGHSGKMTFVYRKPAWPAARASRWPKGRKFGS